MLSLILPAALIPDGTTVCKVTGSKPYKVRREIKIYGENRQEITTDQGLCFLVSDDASITCIKDTLRLRIDFASPIEIAEFIDMNLRSHK